MKPEISVCIRLFQYPLFHHIRSVWHNLCMRHFILSHRGCLHPFSLYLKGRHCFASRKGTKQNVCPLFIIIWSMCEPLFNYHLGYVRAAFKFKLLSHWGPVWIKERRGITVISHERHGVSNHRRLDRLFNSLSTLTKKERSKFRSTGLLWGKSYDWWPVGSLRQGPVMLKEFWCHDVTVAYKTSVSHSAFP